MKVTEKEKSLIQAAVKEAEAKTSGEIVPVILNQSDFYPAAHFRSALLVGIIFSLLCYYLYDFTDPLVLLWIQIPGMVLGYLLAFNAFVKRLLTTKSEMQEEVFQRAIQVFHENNVSMTKDRTGIMIFISLLERRVEVIADWGISQKVERDYWDHLVKALIAEMKKGRKVEGIIQSINTCGESLKEFFPIQKNDINEVSDTLITD